MKTDAASLVLMLGWMFGVQAEEWPVALKPVVEKERKDKPKSAVVVGVSVAGKQSTVGLGSVTTPRGEREPDIRTLFEIGSITKVFTGILLAEAVRRKEVTLADDINTHLPAAWKVQRKNDKPMSLLHLATHRSGLPVQPPLIGLTAKNPNNPYADFDDAALQKLLARMQPSREPGERYEYSNLAVGLLGHALVRAAKAESFDALVQERIAKPWKLSDTAEALTGAQRARLARGVTAKQDAAEPWDFATLEACGCLRSTVNDLLAVGEAGVAKMPTPLQATIQESQKFRDKADAEHVEIGLGWHRSRTRADDVLIWHNGGTGGFSSMLMTVPKDEIVIVVLAVGLTPRHVDEFMSVVLKSLLRK